MCDGELQDRIISCISEVVEGCNSALHSGWRPIFAALRSIKVPFLTEANQQRRETHLPDPSSHVSTTATGDTMSTTFPKVSFDVDMIPTQSIPNKRRISTVLEIFEVSDCSLPPWMLSSTILCNAGKLVTLFFVKCLGGCARKCTSQAFQ